MGFGYRASFIESTLRTLIAEFGDDEGAVESGLTGWRTGDMAEVSEKLIGLKGVGRKVADCVLLMSLDRPGVIPIDTHVNAIAARHPSFPSRLKNKPMSKVLYEETQGFLTDKWGEMGGWTQAVLFAADLRESTVTPRKVKTEIKVESLIKMEDIKGEDMVSEVKPEPLDSPLAVKTEQNANDSPLKQKGKRTFDGLPAANGFKRTRSASRIELKRQQSGVSIVAEQVAKLEVDSGVA
ncbi:N-glycosylase/DNA lyase, partial [Tremellales sp. Uapishka_1]